MSKLRTYCEDCKLSLSRKEAAQITVDSLYDGMDFNSKITRSVNSIQSIVVNVSCFYILFFNNNNSIIPCYFNNATLRTVNTVKKAFRAYISVPKEI